MIELQKFKSKSKNIKNFKKNSIQTDFAKKQLLIQLHMR